MTVALAQEKTNMRSDNAHPGKPALDELVPSRYARKVGAIDVMVISDGVLSLPGAMLAHNADAVVRAAWLQDMFLPPDVLEWALNVVVVRSAGRTILIDAGIGSDPGLNLPRAGQLIHRLEAAGIDLASVTDVVLTHMHMDHIGGLLVDASADGDTVLERIPQPVAAVQGNGVRGGAGGGRLSHRRPHPGTAWSDWLPAATGSRSPATLCSRSRSTTPSGTTASNTTPRSRPASGSISCESWLQTASRWWPLTCRSRPFAMWRSSATPFVAYRPPGSTDRLLG
jgi:hypothetical protein